MKLERSCGGEAPHPGSPPEQVRARLGPPRRKRGEGGASAAERLLEPSAACALALLLALATPALAGPLERIEPRLSRAIEENRVFLTCTSVDPGASESSQRHWRRMVERARSLLVANQASTDELAEFDKRTAVSALVRDDQPLSEVIALCRRHAEWFGRYGNHDFVTKIDETPLPQRR